MSPYIDSLATSRRHQDRIAVAVSSLSAFLRVRRRGRAVHRVAAPAGGLPPLLPPQLLAHEGPLQLPHPLRQRAQQPCLPLVPLEEFRHQPHHLLVVLHHLLQQLLAPPVALSLAPAAASSALFVFVGLLRLHRGGVFFWRRVLVNSPDRTLRIGGGIGRAFRSGGRGIFLLLARRLNSVIVRCDLIFVRVRLNLWLACFCIYFVGRRLFHRRISFNRKLPLRHRRHVSLWRRTHLTLRWSLLCLVTLATCIHRVLRIRHFRSTFSS
ncbi:hypothetical protein EUGRSUZ_H04605 [Eucalyptus grandis]|uniref:Uncharacterized protein n=2 Tax=Eucalyptus grandis TaxID=71139 RepID=A0ACC3JY11_EUCGR|nr:hypothetical protein EUGRSUZ_H04605 [Eucalyptus grandis]